MFDNGRTNRAAHQGRPAFFTATDTAPIDTLFSRVLGSGLSHQRNPDIKSRPEKIHILTGKILWSLLGGFPLYYIGVFIVIAALRMTYPFELEWMEGGMVDHVMRLVRGEQMYVKPTLSFVPFIYPPLFYYLAAGLSLLTGEGFFPLRLVSFLSALGSFVLIHEYVRRETGHFRYGVVATGLYAASFHYCGGWFDIGRIDSLFMCLLLWGIFVYRFYPSARGQILSGLLFSLAFLTKQTALFIVAPLCLHCLLSRKGWARFIFPAIFIGLVGSTTLVFDHWSGGWYRFYVFDLPKQHKMQPEMILGFWVHDLWRSFPLAFLCVLGVGLAAMKNRNKDWFYSVMLIGGLIISSWLSRLHTGGWDNVLMPAFACLAIFFGLGIHQFHSSLLARKQIWVGQLFLLLCVFQFAFIHYQPAQHIPSMADEEAGWHVVQKIRSLPGDVYLPSHGYLPAMGGKPSLAHAQATADIFRSHEKELSGELAGEIRMALRNRKFRTLIFDIPRHYVEEGKKTPWADELFLVDESPWLLDEVSVNYEPSGVLFPDETAFWPVTGLRTRPQQIYRIKR